MEEIVIINAAIGRHCQLTMNSLFDKNTTVVIILQSSVINEKVLVNGFTDAHFLKRLYIDHKHNENKSLFLFLNIMKINHHNECKTSFLLLNIMKIFIVKHNESRSSYLFIVELYENKSLYLLLNIIKCLTVVDSGGHGPQPPLDMH